MSGDEELRGSPFGRRNLDFEVVRQMVEMHARYFALMGVPGMAHDDLRTFQHVLRTVATWETDMAENVKEHKSRWKHWREDWLPTLTMFVVGVATIVGEHVK